MADITSVDNAIRTHSDQFPNPTNSFTVASRIFVNWHTYDYFHTILAKVFMAENNLRKSVCQLAMISNDYGLSMSLDTEKNFRSLIESTRNQILFTIFQLI